MQSSDVDSMMKVGKLVCLSYHGPSKVLRCFYLGLQKPCFNNPP